MMRKMKMPGKSIFATIVVVQILAALFFIVRDDWVSRFLPHIGWILAPVASYLLWQQRGHVWQDLRDKHMSLRAYAGRITAIFACFALFLWQVGALSLSLVQPYVENVQGVFMSMQVLPRDMLSWCMGLAFSLWLVVVCMALCINVAQYNPRFSLLGAHFKKLKMLALYAESFLLLASLTALYVLSFLLILQISKSITVMAGYPQVNVPYTGSAVFILVMYMFNILYKFLKHHRADGKNPKKSMAYLLTRQLGFYLLAWAMSIVVMLCLPDNYLQNLSMPMGAAFLTPEHYALFWKMSLMMWGVSCVPVLSLLLARYSSSLSVWQSTLMMIFLPLGLYYLIQAHLLHMDMASLFNADLVYQWIPVGEATVIFKPSFLSTTAGLSVFLLLSIFKFCPELGKAWVGVMPVHVGRRILRLKKQMSRMFTVGIMLCVLYLLMGSIALAMVFAGYLLALTVYMVLHLGQGLFMSLSLPNTPLQWKRGTVS